MAAWYFLGSQAAALDSWKNGLRIPHGIDSGGHPWIGANQPKLTVEEFLDYACPHCAAAHAELRAAVSRRDKVVRLLRHDYARMACLPVPTRKWAIRCVQARAALCGGAEGRFWETSDWLFSHPVSPKKFNADALTRDVGLDGSAFKNCFDAPETYARAHREYEHARSASARGTPAFVVNGKKATLREAIEAIDATR